VEDEFGAAIIPADVFSRVVVAEGPEQYLNKTALETSGGEIDLTFSEPALIESAGSGDQATLSLSFEISDSTDVPGFRISIVDASWFEAEDANSGAPVTLILQDATYPILSGLARVVGVSSGLDVSLDTVPDRAVTRGQDDVSALALELLNEDPGGLAADVRVSGFDVTLVDTSGIAIAEPGEYVERIRVRGPLQTLLDRPVTATDDTTMTLSLTTPLSVPVNTVLPVFVDVDIADASPLGTIRLQLASRVGFDARDANTGVSVTAEYDTDPMSGAALSVQSPAQLLTVSGDGLLPASVTVGDTDVPALSLQLSNQGVSGTSAVRCDSLTISLRDQRDDALVPSVFLDRVTVMNDSTLLGELLELPDTASPFTVPLSGVTIDGGDHMTIEVHLDVEPLAAPSSMECILGASGIHTAEANVGTPIDVGPAVGTTLPVSSNLTQLQSPPRELRAGFTSLMPPVLVPDGSTVPVARVTLRSPAPEASGPIRIEGFDLDASTADLSPMSIGDAVASVEVLAADSAWATSAPLSLGATQATVLGQPLEIAPGERVTVEIRLTLRDDATFESLCVGFDADGIRVLQSESAVLEIAVEPESGESFPFRSDPGNGSRATLSGSWSNFPNPFAAGRETTCFVFYLAQPADVTLRIFTPRGEQVRTLASRDRFDRGLHQSIKWDGLNGRGHTVRNGVYVAKLDVAFADGTGERLLRKVAVVR
jgi:hypothetical protein